VLIRLTNLSSPKKQELRF